MPDFSTIDFAAVLPFIAIGFAGHVIDGAPPDGDGRMLLTLTSAYTVWQAMGSPQQPTAAQYADLKAAGQLQLLTSPEWLDAHEGEVKITTLLPRQGTSLMRLKW